MDFMTAVKTALGKYVTFSGRARRSEFWWFALFQFICSIVAGIIDGALGTAIVGLIVSLGLLLPGIAVSVRRMHDTGRSGWFVLLFLIPIVGLILALIWFTKRGTVGPNDYGMDPYGMEAVAA